MRYTDSDLATECGVSEGEGIRVQRAQAGGCDITRVRIESEEAALRIGKPQGRYVSVDCGYICDLERRESDRACCAIAVELREMAQRMCHRTVDTEFCVLVVGLGNGDMTPDALGVQTVRALSVTRHLHADARRVLQDGGLCTIAAITTGVVGQTGMEAAELVRGAVTAVSPDLVVAVDALAARSKERLAATVQMSDVGIQPGSGVGRSRRALTRESVGVPVMALGIPTVINCATLVEDALERLGVTCEDLGEDISRLCVCPGEIDLLVGSAGRLLARALERAFHA